MCVRVETAFKLGIGPTDAMAPKYGQQHWPPVDGQSGQNSGNSQQLPYDPNDPVLGTGMTQSANSVHGSVQVVLCYLCGRDIFQLHGVDLF